jgi:hypothetical protein
MNSVQIRKVDNGYIISWYDEEMHRAKESVELLFEHVVEALAEHLGEDKWTVKRACERYIESANLKECGNE